MTANPIPLNPPPQSAPKPRRQTLAQRVGLTGSTVNAKSLALRVVKLLADLRLTLVTLSLFLVLVFVGTLEQVQLGIWIVQRTYFESWFIWKPVLGFDLPIAPGGYLLGSVLIINLLAAHTLRWRVTAKGRQRTMGILWLAAGVALVAYSLGWPTIEEFLVGRSVVALIAGCSALIIPSLVGCWMLFGKRAGIVLIHAGLLVILAGEAVTDWFSVESSMQIDEGGTVAYTEDLFATELAVIDTTDARSDRVFSVSPDHLTDSVDDAEPVAHADWPFRLRVDRYYPNARFVNDPTNPAHTHNFAAGQALADRGFGTGIGVREVPRATATDERDVPAAFLTVQHATTNQTLGTWLVSSAFLEPQTFLVDGKTFALHLRPKRYPKPFSIQLHDFQHEKHAGTAIPSSFASVVQLRDPRDGTDRQTKIYMNHPLRYDGLTLYQASYANNDTTSILQVVKNPGWLLPYLACGLISVGMLAQFGGHLDRFGQRRQREQTNATKRLAKQQTEADNPKPKLSRFTRWAPYGLAVFMLVYAGSKARPTSDGTDFDLAAFGAIPVSHQGRVKPLDTVARSTLLQIYGKSAGKIAMPNDLTGDDVLIATDPDGTTRTTMPAVRWLLDAAAKPELADRYQLFTLHDPDVLGLLGLDQDRKRFAYAELQPHFGTIVHQAKEARKLESAQRTRYQRAVVNLERNLSAYQKLKYTFGPEGSTTFGREIAAYGSIVAMLKDGRLDANEAMGELTPVLDRYATLAERTSVLTIPPKQAIPTTANPHLSDLPDAVDVTQWHTHGDSLLQSFDHGHLDPAVAFFAAARAAYRDGDAERFNALVYDYRNDPRLKPFHRPVAEASFNTADPFGQAMAMYVIAFFLVCLSWVKWPVTLSRMALAVLLVAASFHTLGLIARMWIEARPPVTNLYSSAVFVGWGAVLLGIVLERFWKNGIGTATAGALGFSTLIIAHHLSLTGDTMDAMRAVLDSNFWLATHVVIITFGYAATFLAGFIAILYLLREALTKSLDRKSADAMSRMVYGILCFGILFSFVGTVLGGIWADQSWGRFWGWDPKENGALMIVIWNAIILHARWAKLAGPRGIMMMAVFGNVITAFSWFGVNMLGVGLHSYGFMDAAFFWIVAFTAGQLGIIAISALVMSIRNRNVQPTDRLPTAQPA
ncbi:MAG: cytochrome c biogenesis protein CcsA [Planctomycetota bacterium]